MTTNTTTNTTNTTNNATSTEAPTATEAPKVRINVGALEDLLSDKVKEADLMAAFAKARDLKTPAGVRQARMVAYQLATSWYDLARGAWATKDKAYRAMLARSDAWFSIHDGLAGAGFFGRSKARAQTEGMVLASKDDEVKSHVDTARTHSQQAMFGADIAKGWSASAKTTAAEAMVAATKATNAASDATAAAAKAEIHAEYAKRIAGEEAAKIIAENFDNLKVAVLAQVMEELAKAKPARTPKAA